MASKSPLSYSCICTLSICPVRKKPDESSEMVTQLLFGEQCDIQEESEDKSWLLVRSRLDGYVGWVDRKLLERTENPYDEGRTKLHYCIDQSYPIIAGEDTRLITFGAIFPKYDGMSFKIKKKKYGFSGQAAKAGDLNLTEALVEKLSKKFLNAPYLWGGKTPFGVDCSGLVQVIYRILGVRLPRDAKDQAREGMTIDFVNESITGDLAFFTKASNRITHVGIILENARIIHASGKVRIDNLDHQGIFNIDENKYTHSLKIIKRVL